MEDGRMARATTKKQTDKTRAAIYARVSTRNGQTTENQLRELKAVARRHGWEVVTIYTDDGVSGAKSRDQRPGLDDLLKGVARKEFDVVAAWSVDRLGRSLQDLIATLNELKAKGVDLYLHKQGLDTSTPAGKAMFQMLGVFAEFEREIIAERIHAGLARAREEQENGVERKHKDGRLKKPIGRPERFTEVRDRVLALKEQGLGSRRIAGQLGVARSTVIKALRADETVVA
jgi:DNA invertase Pin-like site-specific DNA recombinase